MSSPSTFEVNKFPILIQLVYYLLHFILKHLSFNREEFFSSFNYFFKSISPCSLLCCLIYFERQTIIFGDDQLKKLVTKDLLQISLFTAMLSVASVFVIPIGPVPITLQVFFFLLIPALLGAYKGALSILLYIILGLIGMPVFAGGSGGFQSVLSPSFGYIIGALFLAIFIGKAGEKEKRFLNMTGIMVVSILLLYTFGMSYQYILMNHVLSTPISWTTVLITNTTAFLPFDILKAIAASATYDRLRSISAIRI